MGKNASEGVVDSFGRSFCVPNLFVLGTSVLPVSFSLHPTFLSAALAIRTANEIIRND
jgi:choline dehydrogenase-like flavoprotein